MLEAHLLQHVLAASLAAAQPAVPASAPVAPLLAELSAERVNPEALPASAPAPADSPAAEPVSPTPIATTVAPAEKTPATPAVAAPATAVEVPGLSDPLEPFNRFSYRITMPIDRLIIRPLALAYKKVVPHPVRDGARNFIRNLYEPVVFFNDVLQLRPKRALHTLLRTTLNVVLGLGGLFDVAKRPPFHLVHHENGFGDTMGYYGIGPVAYLYLPVIGPLTLRDLGGELGDSFAEPRLLQHIVHPDSNKPLLRAKLHFGKYTGIIDGVSGLDQRAESDVQLEIIRRTSVDPYATLRSSYLQNRAGEIAGLKAKDGQAAINPALDDPLTDPAAGK